MDKHINVLFQVTREQACGMSVRKDSICSLIRAPINISVVTRVHIVAVNTVQCTGNDEYVETDISDI